jgi:hypothetical protein
MTLPTYNAMPPVSPAHKPTPTIPQMEDLHERQVFLEKAGKMLDRATRIICVFVLVLLAGELIYRVTFGVY